MMLLHLHDLYPFPNLEEEGPGEKSLQRNLLSEKEVISAFVVTPADFLVVTSLPILCRTAAF